MTRAALDWRARAARGSHPANWADREDIELIAAVDGLLTAPACVDLTVPADDQAPCEVAVTITTEPPCPGDPHCRAGHRCPRHQTSPTRTDTQEA